jgi:hypothetical protein
MAQSLCTRAFEPHHVIRLYVFAKSVSVDWQIKAQGVDKTKTTVSSLGNSGPPLKIQLA